MKYEFVNVPIPAAAHLVGNREDINIHTQTVHDDGNRVPTPSTFLNTDANNVATASAQNVTLELRVAHVAHGHSRGKQL